MLKLFSLLFRITKGCFMSANDIRAMYLHLAVDPRYRDLFGFAVVNRFGVTEYYRYSVIPFGLMPGMYSFLKN